MSYVNSSFEFLFSVFCLELHIGNSFFFFLHFNLHFVTYNLHFLIMQMLDTPVVYAIPCVIAIALIIHLVRKKLTKVYFEGIPVVIVSDRTSCIGALRALSSYQPQVVGFDCEWKPKQNKISLIQIGHERLIILIRIHLFCDSIPLELISFLNNVNVIKCGVGIYGDVTKLKHDYDIDMHGVVDINHIYHSDHYCGLERLSNQLLNRPMQYKHDVDHTQWENDTLTTIQTYYASDDAMVAYHVFNHIVETQYNNKSDVIEICFGKIDINLNKKSKSKSKHQSTTQKHRRIQPDTTLESDKNDMIRLISTHNEFLSLLVTKTAKKYLKKKWAKKVNMNTIQMLIEVAPINTDHDDLFKYERIIPLIEYKCMVCGERNDDQLMWFFVVYRYLYKLWIKSADDPYRVLICKTCNKKAVKWIHSCQRELCDRYLSNKETFREIDVLYQTRNMCYNLKHKNKLCRYTLDEQNTFVQHILSYCKIEAKIRKSICIKEWHLNSELDIDWWDSDDYSYMILRECIDKVCKERIQRKGETNGWIRDTMLNIFKNRKIEFCELFRKSFMRTMTPKYVHKTYPMFEFYSELSANLVAKQSKHKLIDKAGNLLTLTSVRFIRNLQAQTKRINNTTIQLVNHVKGIDYDCDSIRSMVCCAFKEIQCYMCGNSNCKLRIYHVFPICFDRILFGDKEMNIQSYVPLCEGCEDKMKQMEEEFEYYLYLKHDIVTDQAMVYALQLAQQSQRYSLSVTQQNEYIYKIVKHCGMSLDDIEMVKECHCNQEMDMDWYYMDQYDYMVIRQWIKQLIHTKQEAFRDTLCKMFEEKKLRFIQLWINHFQNRLQTNSFEL
eukprot:1149544_1